MFALLVLPIEFLVLLVLLIELLVLLVLLIEPLALLVLPIELLALLVLPIELLALLAPLASSSGRETTAIEESTSCASFPQSHAAYSQSIHQNE